MDTAETCFASAHRKICKQDLGKLDIKFRKLVHTIVGPPGGLDWCAAWHDILHEWNARVVECAEQAGVKPWSRRCLEQHWGFASYIANLSDNRWLKRALAWTADAGRRLENQQTHGMRKCKCTADGKIWENGGQPQCKQIFG